MASAGNRRAESLRTENGAKAHSDPALTRAATESPSAGPAQPQSDETQAAQTRSAAEQSPAEQSPAELSPAEQSPAELSPAEQSPAEQSAEAHEHQHRDVSGGWLRPSVFGAMDGLVTNVSLIAGVGGGGVSPHAIVIVGLAGMAAGAFSMAAGEYVSVSSQNELVESEVAKERYELEHNAESEREELAAMYRLRGVDPDLADEVARQLSVNPDQALHLHVQEELGVAHDDLPSPELAAAASLITFALGALIPLLPYLFGLSSLAAAVGLAALAAFVGGGMVARITARPFMRGALRQLALAALAAALTYGIGTLAGRT
jgi:vacuolar iron transporter family protein